MRGPGRRCRCRSRVARTRSRSLLSARSQRPTVRPQCQRAGESGSGECRCGQACQSRLGSVQPPGIGAGERPPPRCGAVRCPASSPARGRRWSCGRALDKGTFSCAARGSPTCVPISNVCTQLSRLWSQRAGALRPGAGVGAPRPGAGVGVMYGRWTTARPLELRGPWISNVCTDLQRVYPTLTAVGRCAGAVHPGAGIGVKAAVEATTPRKTEFHASEGDRQAVETPRFLNHEPGGQPRTHVSQKPPCLSWQARKPVTFADPRPAPLAWDGGSRSDPGLDPCLFRESP